MDSNLHWAWSFWARSTGSYKKTMLLRIENSIKTALKTWTGGETSAARKLKLSEDRLVDLALERLATFN